MVPYSNLSSGVAGWRAAVLFPLLAYLVSRLAMLVIGLVARDQMLNPVDYVWIYHDRVWLDIWGVWDTGWFLSIMSQGYDHGVSTNPDTPLQANWAFFPLYPMLAAVVADITRSVGLCLASGGLQSVFHCGPDLDPRRNGRAFTDPKRPNGL